MASVRSSTRLRANILQLPPSIRASLYANAPQHRSFSATPSRQLLGLDTTNITQLAVSAPTAVLDGFHAVGIPWCAAIPVTAIVVRGIFGYYLAVRPARRRRDTRSLLYPITHARVQVLWTEYRHRMLQKSAQRGTQPAGVVKFAMLARHYLLRLQETRHVGRDFGAPVFAWNNWFNFAMLIAFSEAVRIKCGTREGLLSLVFGPLNQAVSEVTSKPPPPSDPAEALAERLAAANHARLSKEEQSLSSDALPNGDALAQQIQLPSTSINPPAYVDMIDPTMKAEGLSWIQDLTAPDPTMILPAFLAFFMAANVFMRPVMMHEDNVKEARERLKKLDQFNDAAEDQRPAQGQYAQLRQRDSTSATRSTTNDVVHAMEVADKLREETQKKKRKFNNALANLTIQQRLTLALAGYFFFIGCQLPAALVLYMASTMGTAWLQGRWLDVRYPPRKPIMPCRKPMRYKIKQEYGDG